MEIVPIIYKILLIGGALLTIVVIVSFALSKSTQKEEKRIAQEKRIIPQPLYFDHPGVQGQIHQQPVIIPIDGTGPREIKVVRKHSYEELEYSDRNNGNGHNHAQNGSRRYTILNEEIKNPNYRYVNEG
jgi:hypothetical protein